MTGLSGPIDYAVIGAGVSGAYCAWRLKQAYSDKRTVLFEYSDRCGGRLYTVRLPRLPDVNAELGGMRFIPGAQPLVSALIKELSIPVRDFPMGGEKDPNGLNNLVYLGGHRLRVGEMVNSEKIPYRVHYSERDKSPDDLQAYVMRLLVPDWQHLSGDDWFDVVVLDRKLWEWGFWNLLYQVLTPEAYTFLRYGSGYDTNVSNGNAVQLLPTGGDYSSTTAYQAPVGGMQQIPLTLIDQYQRVHGGELRLNQRLEAIQKREDSRYTLRFVQTASQGERTQDALPRRVTEETAAHVILAMPRRSLELVDWECWRTDSFLRENLGSVLIQGAMKIFLAYDYAWWKSLVLQPGRSLSVLPIRQTFYFGAEDTKGPAPALLMASYNDLETVPFWKGLERGPLYGEGQGYPQATELMVVEAHRQVLALHGLRGLRPPYAAVYQDWSDDPYGGAWHCWKGGFKYNDIIPRMQHPVEGQNVYICGEAYSNDQGWTEGALETAEQLLKNHLKLPDHPITRDWRFDPMKRLRYRVRVPERVSASSGDGH